MWFKINGLILLSIFSQVLCDTTVLIQFVNYTVNTYGTELGTQEQRCCVSGKLLKPFICDQPCSPSLRFCISTDPFGGDTCNVVISTSDLPGTQTYKAGTTLGNISNPVSLNLKSWSVSTKINIQISAQQFNYTLVLANSIIRPLIWPVPSLESWRWRTVVDNVNDNQVVAYKYKVFTTETIIQSDRIGCDPGFHLDGIFCKDINECAEVKDVCNNGTCSNTQGSYRCVCDRGYTGSQCQVDEDECKGIGQAICGVGHSYCVNTVGSYKCVCNPGYTGSHCLYDVDECLADPCNNTSLCINTEGSYKCVCPPGFTSDNCDVDIDECVASYPCQHSSTCINTLGSYTCQCSSGYTGYNCDTDIDECHNSHICNNNSTCINIQGSYRCNCESGYTGRYCEVDIDECLNRPCLHNGACVNTNGGYYCDCPKGLFGDTCQYDHNECLDQPCKNNGTCVNDIGTYSCKCDGAFTGDNCELDNSVCQNGGTPLNTIDGSHCQCMDAYTGTYCELLVDLCLQNPCKHGGSCETLPHSYHCHCTPGYAGINCTEDFDECYYDNKCGSHGNCINTFGSFKCNCKNGFSGTSCDSKVSGSFTSTSPPSTVAETTDLCEDTPGFPCHSAFNMCTQANIAEHQCRKTCGKCGTGVNIVG